MNWNSWGDFFAMGGYALYVWGSVLVTVVALAAEVMALRLRRQAALDQLRRRLRNDRNDTRRNGNENQA